MSSLSIVNLSSRDANLVRTADGSVRSVGCKRHSPVQFHLTQGLPLSRLTDLLREVQQKDAQLGADLAAEVKALGDRRAFGLNFERHTPETVELPGRRVRRGDKVRILPGRGTLSPAIDIELWRVQDIARKGSGLVASLVALNLRPEGPSSTSCSVDDLVE